MEIEAHKARKLSGDSKALDRKVSATFTYFDGALELLGSAYFSNRRDEFMDELTKDAFPALDIKSNLQRRYRPYFGFVIFETAHIDRKDSQAFKAFKVDDNEFQTQRIKDVADYVFHLRTDDNKILYLIRVKRD